LRLQRYPSGASSQTQVVVLGRRRAGAVWQPAAVPSSGGGALHASWLPSSAPLSSHESALPSSELVSHESALPSSEPLSHVSTVTSTLSDVVVVSLVP
jgi:hypothetical protein